jgi:DNA-binding transcriptional LysR family regulator
MEFRRGHLRYFVAVAEEGQMTRAAQQLHLAQPALSQAIAQLEADLGVALLERHPRGVSLTPAGEEFLVKARAAVDAWGEAVEAARAVADAHQGAVEFGFVGSPPGLDSRAALEAFARAHPGIHLRYREMPFPSEPTSAWLAGVDVAVSHRPKPDPETWAQVLRHEPRVVLAPRGHPFASRAKLTVEEVLDETFISFHRCVEPDWAGFWSLDDHRGGPPANATADGVTGPQEVLASLAVRSAITTVPESVGRLALNALGDVVAVPLPDAAPATIVLTGRVDRCNASVEALRAFAAAHPAGGVPGA